MPSFLFAHDEPGKVTLEVTIRAGKRAVISCLSPVTTRSGQVWADVHLSACLLHFTGACFSFLFWLQVALSKGHQWAVCPDVYGCAQSNSPYYKTAQSLNTTVPKTPFARPPHTHSTRNWDAQTFWARKENKSLRKVISSNIYEFFSKSKSNT